MQRKRRQPTEEQKAAAAERRAKFRTLCKQISEMPTEARMALVERIGAVPTCEGRALSVYNSCLLITQFPTVSMVGGFRQWIDKGRCVRKGEHGLMIFIPRAGRKTEADAGEMSDDEVRFFMGTVFDVSQTCELSAEAEEMEEIAA